MVDARVHGPSGAGRGRGARPAFAAICAMLLAGVTGAAPSAAQDSAFPPVPEQPSAFPHGAPGDSPAARERMRELGRKMREEEAARERRLASPESRSQRARSRSAHRGKGDRAAVDLLSGEFAAQLRPIVPDTRRRCSPVIACSASSTTTPRSWRARTVAPRRLIDSQVPLRVPGSADDQELVDLDLVPQGSGFAPENGLVDVQLPSEISNGIELGPVRV